jgi:hypothetical protein
MLGEQLLQLLNIRENSICQENSFEWHHGKRTSAFLRINEWFSRYTRMRVRDHPFSQTDSQNV